MNMIVALLIALVVLGLPTLYSAWRSREFRKFLTGAFFVSAGVQFYLYLAGVSIPLLGNVFVQTPELSAIRASVHFVLFVITFYFGFLRRPREEESRRRRAATIHAGPVGRERFPPKRQRDCMSIARGANGLRPRDDNGGDRRRASLDGSRCPAVAESLYGWSLTTSSRPCLKHFQRSRQPPVRAIRAHGRAAWR